MANKSDLGLKQKLSKFSFFPAVVNVGYITEIGDGVLKISGLSQAMYNELLELSNGEKGLVLNLEKDEINSL